MRGGARSRIECVSVKMRVTPTTPGAGFTDLNFVFIEDGVRKKAYSRVSNMLQNTKHTEAFQIQQFITRRATALEAMES